MAAAPTPARAARDLSSAEEWIGGVGLQNVGSVLLLLGVLFLILWGYSTGRLGPGVLVAAGVALGAAIAWRGDRAARSLPRFGQALVGIGLGTAYLTLCLGYFHLHVLGRGMAAVLLAATSTAGVLLGMRYGAQYFAILGVIGAHLPPLLGLAVPMTGFTFPPPQLLLYLAGVNLVVYVLAWRSGWSRLTLAALLLTALTWYACAPQIGWSWPEEIGLSLLFAGLGLAPLPGIARRERPADAIELAVIAAAPLALMLVSWPFLAGARPIAVAAWSGALFALYAAASLWVERRRPAQDLWRILTAAATLFLTIALQRAIGDRGTPIAWCAEGALLVFCGLYARSGWLRALGYTVEGLAFFAVLAGALSREALARGAVAFVSFPSLRDILCLELLFLLGHIMSRARDRLSERERHLPEVWTALGNLVLAIWIGREAYHWAYAATGGTGAGELFLIASGLGWMLQALVLVLLGIRRKSAFLRALGHMAGAMAGLLLVYGLAASQDWTGSEWPIWHRRGILSLAAALAATGIARALSLYRPALGADERLSPEVWTAAANLLWAAWLGREASHVAFELGRGLDPNFQGGSPFSPAMIGAVWLAQASYLVLTGLRADKPFLRACGHVVALGGLVALLLSLFHRAPGAWDAWFLSHPADLLTLSALAGATALTVTISAARARLSKQEQRAPETWTALLNIVWLAWLAREGWHISRILSGDSPAPSVVPGTSSPALATTGFAWTMQAAVVIARGLRRDSEFLRLCATLIVFAAIWLTFVSLWTEGTWTPALWPVLHPTGVLTLLSILVVTGLTAWLRTVRRSLVEAEQRAPEVWSAAASVLWMTWTAREAGHLAVAVTGGTDPALVATLAAAFTSAAWLLQSIVLMVVGWFRDSAFLRWAGLVLLGVTVLKFLILDLRTVDPFWRFFTAALVGGALLAISYAYQRRQRRRAGATADRAG